MRSQITVAQMEAHLTSLKESAEANLAKWKETFERNPISALEWADDTFVDAARLQMALQRIQLIEYGTSKNKTEEEIIGEVYKTSQREFIFASQSANNKSTGQTKNLSAEARIKVLADFFGWLNNF